MVQTVRKVKRAHVLSPRRGRALRRRGEIERLIAFRAEHRLPWIDPQGLSDVWADTIFVATGTAPDLPMMDQSSIVSIVGEDAALSSCHRLEGFLERVGGRYQPLTGPNAGKLLRLTAEERWACSITTMMAIDETKAERLAAVAEDRRQRDRERKRRERAGTIKQQRAIYEAGSVSRAKPWEALGMSRASWYRAGKPEPTVAEQLETGMSAVNE